MFARGLSASWWLGRWLLPPWPASGSGRPTVKGKSPGQRATVDPHPLLPCIRSEVPSQFPLSYPPASLEAGTLCGVLSKHRWLSKVLASCTPHSSDMTPRGRVALAQVIGLCLGLVHGTTGLLASTPSMHRIQPSCLFPALPAPDSSPSTRDTKNSTADAARRRDCRAALPRSVRCSRRHPEQNQWSPPPQRKQRKACRTSA